MKADLTILTAHLLVIPILGFSRSYPELQPDDIGHEEVHQDLTTCARECRHDEPPRVCHYKWHLEPYMVLGGACGLCPKVEADCFKPQCVSADGFERAILTVNRRLPGPSIHVCKDDRIVVDVKNQLPGGSTTIHWHGIRQRLTPWMDGVPMVTQCPIMEGQTFRYNYVADEPGTYFWHSHDGLQKVDGVVGSLIVREPAITDPMRDHYDYDLPSHTVMIQDWMHTLAMDKLPGRLRSDTGQSPDSYLINGRGVYMRSVFDIHGAFKTPVSEFHVYKGHRYRFRIISGTCLSCPFRFTIQGHKLKVISIDGNPIEPVTVDSITFSSGERYDVILDTSKPPAAYWISVRGLGECRHAKQVALLHYKDQLTDKPTIPLPIALQGFDPGYALNPRNSPCNDHSLSDGICVSQLRSFFPVPPRVGGVPDIQITIPFTFRFFSDRELYQSNTNHKYFVPLIGAQVSGLMNNISNMMPPSPLLTQLYDVPQSRFCHDHRCRHGHEICECINLIKIPLGAVVDFVLVDTSLPSPIGLTHPFHIHGHDFYVVDQGLLKFPITRLMSQTQNHRGLSFLPSKDTVAVPANGYAVLRVLADNPGFWLFHCHFAYHLTTGMSAIVQVGEVDDVPPAPPRFPRCNEYLPFDDYVDYYP